MFHMKHILSLAAFCVMAAVSLNCGTVFDTCDIEAGLSAPVSSSALVMR
jgi:hypothetical protein